MTNFSPYVKRLLQNKFLRFFIVSGINTIFGYGLFALLIYLDIPYPLALFISTIAGILFNFNTIGILVFKNHNNILFIKFIMIYGLTYLLNLGSLTVIKSIGINLYLGAAILVIPIGTLTFILNKVYVFK